MNNMNFGNKAYSGYFIGNTTASFTNLLEFSNPAISSHFTSGLDTYISLFLLFIYLFMCNSYIM